MSVLLLPPIFQFFDNNGDPLANGFVYTYAAGSTTPLATYTDSTGTIAAPNPIELNAAGRPTSGSGAIWGQGAYKFIVKDANGVQVGDVLDNVTSFTTLANATNAYFESFSGNGTQTVFTTSSDLGTEEKGLMVFVSKGLQEIVVNGNFTTDTDWTKGAGWTIAAGVATATGAISTALSQVPVISLVAGQAYAVTYTITRSAGGLIPSLGGQNGTERTASGTYREVIIAAATTPIAFTGNAFTGTLDSVSITRVDAQGYDILSPSAYTINGTSLTFASAPATGTNNIYVFAPSLLLGAASAAANLAQGYASAALASETAAAISASSAAGYAAAKNQWTFSSSTTMADPTTANLRLNNAALASVTQIAISDLSANVGNPDLGAWLDTWDNAGGSNSGSIFIFKDNGNFAIYNVNSTVTDNTTWHQVPVTYVASAGSFSASDALLLGFAASGTTIVTGGITALTGDVTASGSGSVVATLATVPVAKGGTGLTTLTANNLIVGNGTSSPTFIAPSTAGNALKSNGTTFASEAIISAGTAQATTSGTSKDFTGIPSTAKRVTVMLSGVSTNGTSSLLVQIGDSGGIESTGYTGGSGAIGAGSTFTNYTTGFGIQTGTAAATVSGILTLCKIDGNTWVASGSLAWENDALVVVTGGRKTLSDVLDRVRLTTVGGTDTFDAGSVNIFWE